MYHRFRIVDMRRSLGAIVALAMLAVTLVAAPASAQPAGRFDPTDIEPACYEPDIGTTETALGVASSVAEVCFETPELVTRERLTYYAVDIRISGVDSTPWTSIFACGYGFEGWDPDCGHRQASYDDAPVTLWFPKRWHLGHNKTLVQYQHSGSMSSVEGEALVGLGSIQQGMAYTAVGGLEQDAIGFIVDGPFAGNPVPLVSSSMARDVASVASDWLERYTDQAPDMRIVSGSSLGGWVITGLMAGNFFGFEMANNHVDPDDLDSAPFYDAALLVGSSGGPGVEGTVSTSPGATATLIPSIHVEGEQELSAARWPFVADLIDLAGTENARDYVAYWSLRGHTHTPLESEPPAFLASFFEDPAELRNLVGLDRHGPVLAAALSSLQKNLTRGRPLTSHMGGEIVPRLSGDPEGDACFRLPGGPDPDRRVEWQTLDGVATYVDPVKALSTDAGFPGFPGLEPCGLEIDALERIQDALDPEPAIVPPMVAHRVGPVYLGFQNPIAGQQFDVCETYGDLRGYKRELRKTARELRRMGVWKPLPRTTGIRVTDVFVPPDGFPVEILPPGPYPGIIGTFQEQGCA